MRMLVTGRHGQIGRELVAALAGSGEVIATSRRSIDLTRPRTIRRVLRDEAPAVVVNAAGYTDVERAEREPGLARLVNAEAPGVLAEEAARLGAVLVHLSTDYVFDGTGTSPRTPLDPPNPVNAYGATKLAGEIAIRRSGACALILRTSWVFGLHGRNFMRAVLAQAEAGEELRVVDDQHGTPTWSRGLARAIAHVLRDALRRERGGWTLGGREGLYHLACRDGTTWHGLACAILAHAGLAPPAAVTQISTADHPGRARRPARSALDSSRTAEVFGVDLGRWTDAVTEALAERVAAPRPIAAGA